VVFERFTEGARQVIVLAQDEARLLGHDYIGTEHLLLGLLRERDGIGGRILRSHGLELEAVRERVARIVGRGKRMPTGQIPFTRRAKKTLEGGLHAALELGHGYVATEHILLGLAAEVDAPAMQILAESGVDPGGVRGEVIHALSGGQALPHPRGTMLEIVDCPEFGEPPLTIGCPRCGGPLVAFAPDAENTRFDVSDEGDYRCPDCGRTWIMRYAVSWTERTEG
jgi:ATP-dependent Clp protease ATP-binding subunit ClpA